MFNRTGKKEYDDIAQFWIKIFVLIFSMGVATGIVMEFQFGTNWERYSRFVGDIFGAPLAAEGVFSFFLESTFLGVLVFGKKKVSQKFYFASAVLVFLGAIFSGFWIIAANSWQQTPAGYEIVNGRAELTNFAAAIFNPSTLIRFGHSIVGGWISGSFFVAGISAYYLIKKRHLSFAMHSIKISLIVCLVSSLIQAELGHLHAVQVAKNQPEKMATIEALFKTQKNAPLVLMGFPDEEKQVVHFPVKIPGLLSYLIDLDTEYEVQGLNEFAKEDLPPLGLVFYSYRIMLALGGFFIVMAALGLFFYWKDTLTRHTWYLWGLFISIPLPLIANETGWIVAEVGRQPWIVFRMLRTSDAVSTVVSASEILFSIILFTSLYLVMAVLFIFILSKKIKAGPATNEDSEDYAY